MITQYIIRIFYSNFLVDTIVFWVDDEKYAKTIHENLKFNFEINRDEMYTVKTYIVIKSFNKNNQLITKVFRKW